MTENLSLHPASPSSHHVLVGSTEQESKLHALIAPLLSPLGLDVIAVEVHHSHPKKLRVFIDRSDSQEAIGIEDCVRANHALDQPLDESPEVTSIFQSASYELEVSSPGTERPLRRIPDYARFSGQYARIQVVRPLSATELDNEDYQRQNPNQKNFQGIISAVDDQSVVLEMAQPEGKPLKGQKPGKNRKTPARAEAPKVHIPFGLIARAHLKG